MEMETVGMVITPGPIKMTVCQPGEIVMTTTAAVIITIYPPAEIVIVVTVTVAHMGQMLTVGTVPVLTVAMVATVMGTAD